jgi:AP-4 complex subunit beta-1
LEERLKNQTSSVVLATIKIFLAYTVNNPKILKHVYERIQSPLLTLMSGSEVSGSFEIAYIVLSHIQFIVARGGAEQFEREYKSFYCKMDEPTYIKYLKVDILSVVATENNLGDILNELQEYVTDIDTELSRRSIRAIGAVGVRITSVVSAIIKQLASFLDIGRDYITNETMVAFMSTHTHTQPRADPFCPP